MSTWSASPPVRPNTSSLLVYANMNSLLGFAWLSRYAGEEPEISLSMFGLSPEYMGKGWGKLFLEKIESVIPRGQSLRAECTPYAQNMKTMLKRNGFRRLRQSIVPAGCRGLDVYIKKL
ncbi:GNAT family N-acetyltransferase [Aquitalea sp.]|uniref:GNAT family N-acetyltransferase n=2 Tax=Aquitalea TaxID=407217 RepID=UPI00338E45F1